MAEGTAATTRSGDLPLARSPILPAPPRQRHGAWEVSARQSSAALRLADLTALAKIHVRSWSGDVARLGVPFGRAQRNGTGNLVVGEAPDEWLVLGPCGHEQAILAELEGVRRETLATVINLTHGYALVRLAGSEAPAVLAKLCSIDLSARTTPDGTAFRTALAGLVVTIVRDDVGGRPSYLCYCERSSGQFLFDTLMDAGNEFGVDVDGYPDKEI